MKKIVFLLVLSVPFIGFGQTEFHMSQYMLNKPFVNVASIGQNDGWNGAIFYKNQWTGFDGAPTFQGVNVSTPLGSGPGYGGITFINDNIGVNNNMRADFSYAHKLSVTSKSDLIFGASASLRIMQSDYSEIQTDVGGDPLFSQNSPTILQPNFNFGTIYYTEQFHVGFSIPNLLTNSIEYSDGFHGSSDFDINSTHFYLHSGYRFDAGGSTTVEPFIMLKQVSGAPLQGDLNINFTYKNIGAGWGYRSGNEIVFMASYVVKEAFTIGYAYDLSFSELSNYSSGSHEIMIIYREPQTVTTASLDVE